MSNMGLCVSVKLSFICNSCLHKLHIWNHSSVFSDWPFFLMCSVSDVSGFYCLFLLLVGWN
jgi:hypothetical protein